MNTSDVKSDSVIKRQTPIKKMETRKEQRMKKEQCRYLQVYRHIPSENTTNGSNNP